MHAIFHRDVQHLTRIQLSSRLSSPSVIAQPFLCIRRCQQMTSAWADYRVRTIQSKVNQGQVSSFMSRGLADPDYDIVCTMQRHCCLHHVAMHDTAQHFASWHELEHGTKMSKLDATGNTGWLPTPVVICMPEIGP